MVLKIAVTVLLLLALGVGWNLEKRRQKKALRRSEQRHELSRRALRTVLDSIDAFVYVADMESYELLFLNRYGKEQWGDLTGKTCWQVLQTDQKGPCSFCTNARLLDEGGKPTGPYRWEFKNTVNGRWCDISDRAIQWVDGRVVRLEIATDITERKAVEAELVKARVDAEQANVLKSSFLANMSHEIRTPLNVIVGMSHLLEQTQLSSDQDDYISNIRDSAHVLLEVIDDILDLSKIESGKFVIEQTPFLLCEVLERLGNLLGTKAAGKGVELLFSVDPAVPPALQGDPFRLEQVLINLVQNALKFTEAGEVEVGINVSRKTAEGYDLGFFVSDTGEGIDPGSLESLFEAFVQADSSTSRKHGGSGLGLTICKHLVEMMGGRIEAESTVGVGSRFSFVVPLAQPTTALPSPTIDLEGRRVLIVEKNTSVRRALSTWLRSVSARVEQASSPNRALELVAAARLSGEYCHLLIVDGDMAGSDLVGFLGGLGTASGVAAPAVIITSHHRNRRGELLSSSPAERTIFLAKPVCPAALFAAVREAFDSRACDHAAVGGNVSGNQLLHLAGKRVLVVEDDPINQQVVGGLLQSLGIEVTLAGGGRAAIEAVATVDFDLVLMDVQMPDMDGLQTTRLLRSELLKDDLPIVALTAHAMRDDRDRCLAAGMNDHLTKPIDPNRLSETLGKWLGADQSEVFGEHPVPDSEVSTRGETAEPVGDVVFLDVDEGVRRVGGVRATYMRLLRQFVADHGGVSEVLRRCVADGDVDQVRRLTHTLQGVAANLGAHQLAGISRALGQAAGTAPAWDVQRILVQLDSALATVVDIVSAMEDVGRGSDRTFVDPDDRGLPQSLAELAAMLGDGDAESLERLRSLRRKTDREDLDLMLARAESQVRAYDYDQALQSLMDASKILDIDLERGSAR